MRRKILFISSWYPTQLDATNGNFVQRHAEAAALYNDVEVLHAVGDFSLKDEFEVIDSQVNGIRTVIIYYKNSKSSVRNFLNRMKAYHYGFKMMNFPDLVHANVLQNNMLFAVYLKRRFKIPFVVSEHWSGFLPRRRPELSEFSLKIARFIAGNAEVILPVSDNLLSNLKQLAIGRRHIVLPNVVDTKLFRPFPERRSGVFTFLHISNLIGIKRPLEIIEAAVKLKAKNYNFKLNIGGDGDTQPLRKAVKEAGAESFINVFGAIPHHEVATEMQQAHCFILFSEYENQPCVLLESLSCGLPVISTSVGGVSEFIMQERGILIGGTTEELTAAMEKVLKGEIEFAPAEKLHTGVVDAYSNEAVGKKLSEIYRQIIDDKI